ncbi:MAG: hypothetical protein F6J93_30420 [Oscillatoria sp. SIO1A7]|nr:hypothetical protein [Oscillatoria sp. SIO1A7]
MWGERGEGGEFFLVLPTPPTPPTLPTLASAKKEDEFLPRETHPLPRLLHDRRVVGVGDFPTRASYWSMPKSNFPKVIGLLRASSVFKGELFFL